MQQINRFDIMRSNDFNLSVAMIRDEFNYNLIGILKKDDKIIEYCETINIPDQKLVSSVYSIIKDNMVFPCHFYNIIDDI